ncbi:hypothetical protein [Streptomyces sp. NPDC088270]|uniref:hypothetical protein n=1 Tax=unclassified Streptomyces TaxID=2593676 RepID=UPI00343A7412
MTIEQQSVLAELARLRIQVATMRAPHVKYEDSNHCRADSEPWPCPTVTVLAKDTSAAAGATFTPATVLIGIARALREQPTAVQLLDGLDELGELAVCDSDPAEIASWVAALCRLARIDVADPDACVVQPAVVYRAEHDGIVDGLYTTADAARRHCEALVSREYPADATVTFDWLADEEDADLAVAELVVQIAEGEVTTGYTVTPLEVAAAYDPDADE